MRIARFALHDGRPRLGLLVETGQERLLDVESAASAMGERTAPDMAALMAAGRHGLDDLRVLLQWAQRRADPSWFHHEHAVHWLTPVPPRSIIAAGRNFGRHRLESIRGNPATGRGLHIDFPTGFIKLGRTLVPHRSRVKRPAEVSQMDHEVEIAVVLARPLENASRTEAADALFGYTIFNDLSARDWQIAEMHNNLLMLGKNFPGFGPLGPCILTADEVPDPTSLVLWLKVNGDIRQHSDCKDLIFGFSDMVAFWSKVGLQAGDVISTGTPEGVALHRKPDPAPYFLKPGDVVEAGVDGIGTLTTFIV